MRGFGKQRQFPLARSHDLLIEEVDAEKVIFDKRTKKAHCLTPLAAIVFAHCDGDTSSTELAEVASARLGESLSEADVENALAQLQERDLLDSQLPITFSRRDVLNKGAAFGAAAAAAALVFTVDPALAQAAGRCTSISCTSADNCFGGTGCGEFQSCNRCVSHKCACHTIAGPAASPSGSSLSSGGTGSLSSGGGG